MTINKLYILKKINVCELRQTIKKFIKIKYCDEFNILCANLSYLYSFYAFVCSGLDIHKTVSTERSSAPIPIHTYEHMQVTYAQSAVVIMSCRYIL